MDSWVVPSIVALWTLFLATHMGLSSRTLRSKLTRSLGTRAFLAVYSTVALALFIPLVWIYATHKHAGAFLWYGSTIVWMRPLVYAGMTLALTLMIGGNLDPSPASIAPGSGRIQGVLRITRHPLFMGVALFGLLHLGVAQVYESDLAFFGGLPIVGLVGCWHQDRRHLANGDESFRRFYEATSFVPFGRGGVRGLIDRPIAFALGLAATVSLRFFHPVLFGGAG